MRPLFIRGSGSRLHSAAKKEWLGLLTEAPAKLPLMVVTSHSVRCMHARGPLCPYFGNLPGGVAPIKDFWRIGSLEM